MPQSLALETSNSTPSEPFHRRHNGPDDQQIDAMLTELGIESLDQLVDTAIPASIRIDGRLKLDHGIEAGLSERAALSRMQRLAEQNQIFRSHIGLGYYDCTTPPVIQRNILESPGWYTAYTPYQAELAQGRLEALLNFQTLVMDLTGFDMANASLLDEATAAAEAMTLCWGAMQRKAPGANRFVVGSNCHPHTVDVLSTRARPLGIEVVVAAPRELASTVAESCFGVLLQYPGSDGGIGDPRQQIATAKDAGAMVVVAADPLALVLLESPQQLGADVAIGSMQRFGMPMAFGGPHAAYIATAQAHKRLLPGRVVGISKDSEGRPALRLAMQTREQHIRRDKATSNICTAQVLPAVIASMYAVYHGPEGLRSIAEHAHACASQFAAAITAGGGELASQTFFDTVTVLLDKERASDILARALSKKRNLRDRGDGSLGISFDETSDQDDIDALCEIFGVTPIKQALTEATAEARAEDRLSLHRRTDSILTASVWRTHRSETEMLRYLHQLEAKDLALNVSMIPLGSCTMKLNATAEMMPITWPGFADIHPFAPSDQTRGYHTLCRELEDWLAEITGFAAISLQPNAGSQGEYAGLLAIHRYHEAQEANGATERDVCLIPTSAHGTNPASAVMAGMRVVPIRCDDQGNIDVDDLRAKAEQHTDRLSALMITYPSTHGVFEESIRDICSIIHQHGGRVYLDGANMNAQVGLCRPGDFGADVCHLNLHKTFCIPHGGGGPGMGPIGVVEDLVPYLPGHRVAAPPSTPGSELGAISAAQVGSGAILPISWAYIAMMGTAGLEQATRLAILNANYIAARLEHHYPVLYRGNAGLVAHECILDLRPMKDTAGVTVDDVAKRLIDFGFHAPTVSWPVAGTVMVEPTESESKAELDRFCDAMIAIREEARAIERGEVPLESSALRNAPHTAEDLLRDDWDRAYARFIGAYPAPWLRAFKYWPPVSRVDNAWGDRNLVCSCVGMEAFTEQD